MADWLLAEIATGFQRLVTLSLPNTPASDVLVHAAQIWHEALLSTSTQWDKVEDDWRIQRGFALLCRDCDRWPVPKHLIDRLPARKDKLALPKPTLTPEQRAHNLATLKTLMQQLGEKML